MLRHEPDVFVHSGDMIYADNPLLPEVPLADGRVWKNLVTPAKSKVAETLDEFRGNYAYNLLDEHMRRFNASVPDARAVGRPRGDEQLASGDVARE